MRCLLDCCCWLGARVGEGVGISEGAFAEHHGQCYKSSSGLNGEREGCLFRCRSRGDRSIYMSNHDRARLLARGYHFGIREIDGLDPRLCDWECYLVPLIRWKSRQRSVYYEKKRIRESDDWWKEAKQR
jgi:hypothetical protein